MHLASHMEKILQLLFIDADGNIHLLVSPDYSVFGESLK
jgi:hypothetical protein